MKHHRGHRELNQFCHGPISRVAKKKKRKGKRDIDARFQLFSTMYLPSTSPFRAISHFSCDIYRTGGTVVCCSFQFRELRWWGEWHLPLQIYHKGDSGTLGSLFPHQCPTDCVYLLKRISSTYVAIKSPRQIAWITGSQQGKKGHVCH